MKANILLAEDNGRLAYLMKRALERSGHTVDLALDGTEAWQKLRSAPEAYQALVTDLNMPGLSGIDLLHNARSAGLTIPAIVLSGYVNEPDEADLMALGVQCILRKPQQIQNIREVLALVLGAPDTAKTTLIGKGHIDKPALRDANERPNILLLESDIVTSRQFMRLLSESFRNTQVLPAFSIGQATVLTESVDINVLVTEVRLPDGNGIEFVCDLLSTQPEVKVIIVTDQELPPLLSRYEGLRIGGFLKKPVTPEDLVNAVAQCLTPASQNKRENLFKAHLSQLTPIDVLQLKCMAAATQVLKFSLPDGRYGQIHLKEGHLVYAIAGLLVGVEAFQEMISWKNGEVFEAEYPEKSEINMPPEDWQTQLMEAVQKMDEAGTTPPPPPAAPTPVPETGEVPAMTVLEQDLQRWCELGLHDKSGQLIAHLGASQPGQWNSFVATLNQARESLNALGWGSVYRLDLVGTTDCAVAGFRPDMTWLAISHLPQADPRDLERTATLLIKRDPFRSFGEALGTLS